MAVRRYKSTIDVVQAAKRRIKNVFNNGLPVYLAFSGGKDSIVLAELVIELLQTGEISADQLIVQFIDEEAIFPCIEQTVKNYRKRFLLLGAKFEWYCLEVKHYNCFNMLSSDETFICWDSTKPEVWVRQPPSFAIRDHVRLKKRTDTYQMFLDKKNKDGLQMLGVRVAESVQRLRNFSVMFKHGKPTYDGQKVQPIYDWKDEDVWRYIQENHIDFPDIYLYLWQAGTSKRMLRVSQFFSIDTARNLVKMNEYYPDLMERVIRREPNAYLAVLYWDSEMFGRSSKARKDGEDEQDQKDYRKLLTEVLSDIDKFFPNPHHHDIAKSYRSAYIKYGSVMNDVECKKFYESLMAGDPKRRSLRAHTTSILVRYNVEQKTEAGAPVW